MGTFIEKFGLERYVSSRLILLFDLLVSVLASFLSLACLGALLPFPTGLVSASFALYVAGSLCCGGVMFYALKTYRTVIRHSSLRDLGRLALAVAGKSVLLGILFGLTPFLAIPAKTLSALLFFDFLLTLSLLLLARVGMVMCYDVALRHARGRQSKLRVLIYGIAEDSVALSVRFRNSPRYFVTGFLCYGERQNKLLSGHRVYYFQTEREAAQIFRRFGVDAVLFAGPEAARTERERLLRYLSDLSLKALTLPPIDELRGGQSTPASVREIRIEDLLGREEIRISMKQVMAEFRGKTVMVTGAAGSIGSELCRQLAGFGIRHLVLFDNAETPMHNIRLELEECFPQLRFTPIIGDVRQKRRLDFAFRAHHPQVVFHAAAYKHVPLMEENPCEAVLVNVAGSRNVADKCLEYGAEKMVMISTDKAVNPTNIMGCTKRLAEIYVQALGLSVERGETAGRTKFVTTRFGNVLGSNGSVIPRFREQISKGGPVTVTHPDITRFFMTIPEACRLVMEAATMTTGTRIFVFDMGKSVKIAHLAKRMIELAGLVPGRDIQIEYTGLRPGEKLYEEVLSTSENTLPTSHDRIRVAKVREYPYADAVCVVDKLEELSRAVEIPDMVRLMKRTVPEFKSRNSIYEQYDRELERTEGADGLEHSFIRMK